MHRHDEESFLCSIFICLFCSFCCSLQDLRKKEETNIFCPYLMKRDVIFGDRK